MAHHLPLADYKFIADFAAFCRGKPADEAYDYMSCYDCACAQFLKATDRAKAPIVGGDFYIDADGHHSFPAEVARAIHNGREGNTFAALATRLEALIADSPAVVRS